MKPFLIGGCIVLFTLLGYFQFPGHTWLESDTQIYAPILEHLRDTSVLRNDILVQRPHVSFTVYDETALTLRRITGLDFHTVLAGEQLVFRALGIWGLYLVATALGLPALPALLVTAIFSLGATVGGPTVLTFEYEPVPRGFAVPLLVLALGFTIQGRYLAAGLAGAAAFLMHPPTVYPFWGVYFCLALWPADPQVMRRRIYAFIPLFGAALLLLVASRHQAGVGETQAFFTRLTPLLERLQLMRAPYVWVSLWWRTWLPYYLLLYALALAAYWRLRKALSADMHFFLLGLPLVGILSMPLSYVLLEQMKWAIIPQLQPMRALLFVSLIAAFLAAAAGCRAAVKARHLESFCWFAAAYVVPAGITTAAVPSWRRIAVVLVLGALAAGACSIRGRGAATATVVAALAGFFLIPSLGGVRNYPELDSPELDQLAQWARTSTPKEAVFLFPDAGRQLYPGIFREHARRAVYVDWKGGGQVNYLEELGEQWWARWRNAMMKPKTLPEYRAMGIDYVVLRPAHRIPREHAAFENSRFVVYRLK